MIVKFVARLSSVLALSAPLMPALQPTQAAAQGQSPPALRAPTYEQQQQGKINAWTVGRRYDLAGLKIVRDQLAGPCKWPATAGARRN
jgi:hypothetical protein